MGDTSSQVHGGPKRKDQRSSTNGGPGRVYTEEQLNEKYRKQREKYLVNKPDQAHGHHVNFVLRKTGFDVMALRAEEENIGVNKRRIAFAMVEPIFKKLKEEKRKNSTIVKAVLDFFRSTTNCIIDFASQTKDLVVKSIREKEHNPIAVNRTCDNSHSSVLNYASFNCLNKMCNETKLFYSSSTYAKSNLLTSKSANQLFQGTLVMKKLGACLDFKTIMENILCRIPDRLGMAMTAMQSQNLEYLRTVRPYKVKVSADGSDGFMHMGKICAFIQQWDPDVAGLLVDKNDRARFRDNAGSDFSGVQSLETVLTFSYADVDDTLKNNVTLHGAAFKEFEKYIGDNKILFHNTINDMYYLFEGSLCMDMSGAWKLFGIGSPTGLHWCVWTSHRRDCVNRPAAYNCESCYARTQNGEVGVICHCEEIISSGLEELYINLGKDPLFANAVIEFPDSKSSAETLTEFLGDKLGINLEDLVGRTYRGNVSMKFLHNQISEWKLKHFLLPHQIDSAPEESVIEMLKVMGSKPGSEEYKNILRVLKSSQEWKRKKFSGIIAPNSMQEKKEVCRYLFYIGNKISYCRKRRFERGRMLTKVEALDIDKLHLQKALASSFNNMLIFKSGKDGTKNLEDVFSDVLSGVIDMTFDRDEDEEEYKTVTIKIEENEPFKTSISRHIKLMKSDKTLEALRLTKNWEKTNEEYLLIVEYQRLLIEYFAIMDTMRYLTVDEMDSFRDLGQRLVVAYIKVAGENKIHNYMNCIQIGLVDHFCRLRGGTINLTSQSNIELKIKADKSYCSRRCNPGGHCGIAGKFTIAESMNYQMSRQVAYLCDRLEGTNNLVTELNKKGLDEKNAKRRELYRLEKETRERDEE